MKKIIFAIENILKVFRKKKSFKNGCFIGKT